MRRLAIGGSVLISTLLIPTAIPAAHAQERIELPMLDGYRLGARSMIAAETEEPVDAILGGGLSVGPRYGSEWKGPFAVASLSADLGMPGRTPYNRLDFFVDLDGRWGMVPGEGSLAANFDLRGNYAAEGQMRVVEDGDFSFDFGIKQRLRASSSGTWGLRALDVAPEAFSDLTIGISTLFNHGSEGDVLKSMGLSYEARFVGYKGLPISDEVELERSVLTHRLQLRPAARLHEKSFRLDMAFAAPTYIATASKLSPWRWHRVDLDLVSLRAHGAESKEDSGLVTLDAGVSAMGANHHTEALITPKIKAAVRVDLPAAIDFGIAGGHEAGFGPSGERAIGVTSMEAHVTIDPEPHFYGTTLRGRFARLVELRTDIDDAWLGHVSGEFYTRIVGVQLGAEARGSYGSPTGSMGWDPFHGTEIWSAYVGGFLRAQACFSARCKTDQ